jgi:hypothetical protein
MGSSISYIFSFFLVVFCFDLSFSIYFLSKKDYSEQIFLFIVIYLFFYTHTHTHIHLIIIEINNNSRPED